MKLIAVPFVAIVVLSACGSDSDTAAAAVTVTEVWSRASAPTQSQGVVYFDLTVADDDTLLRASVPSSVAAGAEIHEVVLDEYTDETGSSDGSDGSEGAHDMDEMDEMDDEIDMDTGDGVGDASGRMRMQELPDGLALTGGETVSFEPGGYHVMLPDLVEPLAVGDEFELTLQFENADEVTLAVEVAESAP